MTKVFVIAERKTDRRGSLEGRTEPTFTYEPDLRIGKFKTRIDAKASFARYIEPDLKNASDEYAAKWFDSIHRTNRLWKVVAIDEPNETA